MIDFDAIDAHRVKPDDKISLSKIDTRVKGPFDDKEAGVAYTAEILEEIKQLQYRLYAEEKQSILVVLQAPDAAGKDGLIRKVFGPINPQGCRTTAFKVPTPEERAHDFLWRIHRHTPAAGMIQIFNRSHYEDVLIVRVEDLVPKDVWKSRYDLINAFERTVASNRTRILKFYLHISPEEQLERFGERLNRPEKHWKLNPGDYEARAKWDDYRDAYEDAIHRCNTDDAPWHVIPADRKWYRNAAVATIIRDELRRMDPQFPDVTVDLNEIRRLYEAAGGAPEDRS